MRFPIVISLLFLFVAGCKSGDSQTFTDDKGNTVQVKESGDKFTAETKEGKMESDGKVFKGEDNKGNSTIMGESVTEAEFGAPFYPGSTEKKEGGSIKSKTADGRSSIVSVRTTPDAGAKVMEFYNSKLGKPRFSAGTGDDAVANWEVGNRTISITTNKKDGVTIFTLVSITKPS